MHTLAMSVTRIMRFNIVKTILLNTVNTQQRLTLAMIFHKLLHDDESEVGRIMSIRPIIQRVWVIMTYFTVVKL